MSPTILSPNPWLASIQLLVWLLFCPSAWRQHIAAIDPHLPPDFSLSALTTQQWFNPKIRYLLKLIYVVIPLLAGIGVWLILWSNNYSEYWFRGGLYTLILSFAGGIISGITVSVAFSLIASVIASVLIGLLYGFETIWYQLAILSSLLAVSIASSVLLELTTKKSPQYTLMQHLSSIVISLLASSIILIFSIAMIHYLEVYVFAPLIPSHSPFVTLDTQMTGFALGIGICFGLFTHRWHWALILTTLFGAIMMVLPILPTEKWFNPIIGSLANSLLFPLFFALPYLLANYMTNRWSGVVAGLLGSGGIYIAVFTLYQQEYQLFWFSLIVIILGLTQVWWRPLLFYPLEILFNMLLYRAEEYQMQHEKPVKNTLLRWHAVYWDEHQWLKLFGLDKHLVIVAEGNPEIAQAIIANLGNTPQAWAAQAAQLELSIRQLQSCTTIAAIKAIYHNSFPEERHESLGYLKHFQQLSLDVNAALARESHHLRQQALEQVIDSLGRLSREMNLTANHHEIALSRLRLIVEDWRQVITDYLRQLVKNHEQQKEINNPYITGVPLRRQDRQIFVGRQDISARIEQLLQSQSSPPILLYGQRRMGKTSLLNQLSDLLPTGYIPLFVDLEGVLFAAPNHSSFFYNLSRAMIRSAREYRRLTLPRLDRETLQIDPFTEFDEWLDSIEDLITDPVLLLTLDEFEALDYPFSQGRLDPDLILGLFRHMIQHRPRFKILISGRHLLETFPDWANYLINTETIHLSYLQIHEAQQLIENPVETFTLHYAPEAIQRILELSHCHPALVQLLCKEIINLKNTQAISGRNLVQSDDVEAVIPYVLMHGRALFIHIANLPPNEMQLLRIIAAQGESMILSREALAKQCDLGNQLDKVLLSLVQQEFIEFTSTGYRFQVELIRRWFI
jgi:hypothetical protein